MAENKIKKQEEIKDDELKEVNGGTGIIQSSGSLVKTGPGIQ